MLARRALALSPDKAFGKVLATALRAAGATVDVAAGLDALGAGELQAALAVIHLDGELAGALPALAARLPAEARVIAVTPRHDLATTVAALQASDRVAAVLVADGLRPEELSAAATRLLAGDIFGLDKAVSWGTRVYAHLVSDYQEKSLCIAQLSEFAESMGVRRKFREAIEQVVDEMLMNALYDAPVDEQGRQVFAEIPTKSRISVRMEQKVVVQYACDHRTFSVSVRDSFGTLERGTVIRYLDKCLHSDQQIDRKTGGAGLGLYLMANSTTRMTFNVLPGVATEALCQFALDGPRVQLQELGFYVERIDAAGRLAAGPTRVLPSGAGHPVERRAAPTAAPAPRGLVAGLSAAIALLVVLIALVAYPRLKGAPRGAVEIVTTPGATIEVPGEARVTDADGVLRLDGLEAGRYYTVAVELAGHAPATSQVRADARTATRLELPLTPLGSRVTIESDPPGAAVTAGDTALGVTPLTTDALAPGARLELTLRLPGYADKKLAVAVPAAGGAATFSSELAVAPDVASVIITSEPPGAAVFVDGVRRVGVTTPTGELLVEAGRRQEVRLELDGHVPAVVELRPDRGARQLPVAATLVRGVPVRLSASLAGRVTVDKLAGCARRELPAECLAAAGTYVARFETTDAPGSFVRRVAVGAAPVDVALALGIVEAPAGRLLVSGGQATPRLAVEAGRAVTLTVRDRADGTTAQVPVRVEAGKTLRLP